MILNLPPPRVTIPNIIGISTFAQSLLTLIPLGGPGYITFQSGGLAAEYFQFNAISIAAAQISNATVVGVSLLTALNAPPDPNYFIVIEDSGDASLVSGAAASVSMAGNNTYIGTVAGAATKSINNGLVLA